MPNGLALPTRVNEIDTELQSLEFMKQSLESLQAVRGSLGEASTVLDQMKTDHLKGDTLSVKDVIDLTEFPADLVTQAVETQTTLQAYAKAIHNINPTLHSSNATTLAKNAKTTHLIGETLRTRCTLRAQRIVELEILVRTNSHGLATIKLAIGAGIAAVAVFGAFLFTSGGNECSTTGALTAAGVHITASSDPCPDDAADPVSVTDDIIDDIIEDRFDWDSIVGSQLDWDEIDKAIEEGIAVRGDEESQVDEREPVFAPLVSDLEARLDLAGVTPFERLIESVDANAYAASGTGGPVVIDPPGDQIYSDPSVDPFMRATVVDILVTQRLTLAIAWDLIETPTDPGGDFGCDRNDELVIVVCPDSDLPFPDEPAAWTFVGMNASIPAIEGPSESIYSYVLDADGDRENNWQTQGPYTWDFYQGTDTWFELIRSAEDGEWRATVSRVTADQQIEPIDLPFRVILWDNIIWWWIPESSAPTDAPFRVSAFIHDGTYSQRSSSGDVLGANPTEGLFPREPSDS